MKYGKKLRQLVRSLESFESQDWIPYKRLKQTLHQPDEFLTILQEAIKKTDQVLVTKNTNKESSEEYLMKEAQVFAYGNKEAVRKIVKKFNKKSSMEVPLEILELYKCTEFYNYPISEAVLKSKFGGGPSPSLNAKAPCFSPKSSMSSLRASAPAFVLTPPSKISCTFEFNPSAASFTPKSPKTLSASASPFVPCSSLDQQVQEDIEDGSMSPPADDADNNFFDYKTDETPGDLHPLQQTHSIQLHPMTSLPQTSTESVLTSSMPALPSAVKTVKQSKAKPKVLICNVEENKYSMDWLLEQRLKNENIPVPATADIPPEISFPVHSRKQLFSETTYESEETSMEFDIGRLSHLVSPVFADEINYDNVCDPYNGVYGQNWLRSVQHLGLELHPALLDKPEIISSAAKNYFALQVMSNLAPMMGLPGYVPGVDPMTGQPMIPPMMEPGMMQILTTMLNAGANGIPPTFFPFGPENQGDCMMTNDSPNTGPRRGHVPTPSELLSKKIMKEQQNRSPRMPRKMKREKSIPYSPRKPREKVKPDTKPQRYIKKSELEKKPEVVKKRELILKPVKKRWTRQSVVVQEADLAARTMQSILNKLVPEKFERLLTKALKDIHVTKKETLLSLTQRLHKKAISESTYAFLYTHFVRRLKTRNFKSFTENSKEVNIETILLQETLDRLAAVPDFNKEDPELESKEKKFNIETLGNYTLLGELFKREIITYEKVCSIIKTLVTIVVSADQPPEERGHRLQQLFALLRSCGTEFEDKSKLTHSVNKCPPSEHHFLDKQFQLLATIKGNITLKPRVRFMLQDLIDLKNKHWEQRTNKEIAPKILSEIREEIRKEKKQKEQYIHSLRRSARKCGKRKKAHTPKPTKVKRKLNFTKSQSHHDLVRLKKKERVRIGKPKHCPKVDKLRWASIVKDVLSENDAHREDDLKQEVVEGAWKEEEREELSSTTTGELSCGQSSLETDENVSSSNHSSGRQPEQEIDELLLETTILELFDSYDIKNALLCCKEALSKNIKPERLVFSCINLGIDMSEKHRNLISKLLVQLFEQKLLTTKAFSTGVVIASEFFDDWKLDVPKLHVILADWILSANAAAASDLVNEIRRLQEIKSVCCWADVLAEMLKRTERVETPI